MIDKELLKMIEGKKKWIVFAVICNLISLILNVGITALLVISIYSVIREAWLDGMIYLFSSFAVVLVKMGTAYLQSYYSTKLASYVVQKFREETYQKYLAVEGKTPFSTQEMAQLSTEGIEQLRLYYSNYLPSFFYAMIAPLFLFMLFLFLDLNVAFLYLGCVPLIPISIIIVSKWAKKIFNKYWDQYTSLGDSFLDNINGMKELKIFSYDEIKQEQMKEESNAFRKITMKVLTMQLASTTIMDLVAFGGAGIGIFLSLQAMRQGLDPYITIFMILVGAEFFLPMRALGSAFHVAMNGATAGKKAMELFQCATPLGGSEEVDCIRSIDLQDVSFTYDEENIVSNVSLRFERGFHSIVGLSGSGKSTIAKLISRQLNPQRGSIKWNNSVEIKDIVSHCFYEKTAYISNQTFLFHRTIRESFLFYNSSMTEEEMMNLLRVVKLEEFIVQNGGLDYRINASSSNISGGEKQRLILAFYMSKPFNVYIIDEATSNIDPDSEKIILDILYKLAEDSIVIFISHRLKNIVNSKKIYYLEDQTIIASGTCDHLLESCDSFKLLFEEQQRLEEAK